MKFLKSKWFRIILVEFFQTIRDIIFVVIIYNIYVEAGGWTGLFALLFTFGLLVEGHGRASCYEKVDICFQAISILIEAGVFDAIKEMSNQRAVLYEKLKKKEDSERLVS